MSPEVATTEKFSTIGVRHKIRRAGLPPHPPLSWNCIGMYGTSPTMILPLAQPVAKELDCRSRLHRCIVRRNSSL